MTAERNGKRVLVIGLDGATWTLLDGWAREGHLPNLQRLREGGAWSSMRVTIPPVTPSCWSSMYTGSDPGKHGVFGFFRRRPSSYRLTPVRSLDRRVKTVFRLLSDAGLKVGVLNAPAMYPPERLNGFVVPGIPVPEDAPDYTYPREFAIELDRITAGKHKFPPGLEQATQDVSSFFDSCREYALAVTEATKFMMERLGDWNFLMVQFQVTDTVQHHFWHGVDSSHPRHDPDAPAEQRDAILHIYQMIDRCIADIVAEAGGDEYVDILIVSDHGAGSFNEQLHLNTWLWQRGWLKFKRSPICLARYALYRLGITPEFVRRAFYSQVPNAVRKGVESKKSLALSLADRVFLSLQDVDWSRTRAYSYGSPLGSIYLNLEGREPQGAVPKERYESVLSELEDEIRAMRHPTGGEPIIERTVRPTEIYASTPAENAPDLQIITQELKYHNRGFLQFQSDQWIGPPENGQTGSHSLDGVLLMAGPHVKPGVHLQKAHITDIAPTVLALLGQTIPEWMDGEPLAEGLEVDHSIGKAKDGADLESVSAIAESDSGYSAEEAAEISKRLEDLGYVE